MTNREKKNIQSKCTVKLIDDYKHYLYDEEKSINTINKYVRDLKAFFKYLGKDELGKSGLVLWKEHLSKTHTPASINSMLAAVNGFLEWMGLPEYKVKPLKIQRSIFTQPEKELTEAEYKRLIKSAEREDNRRLSLLLQTICATGIRVSELGYITAEAVHSGRTTVECKGKSRTVFLPRDLCKALRRFCQDEKIEKGVIFKTKSGKPIDRSNIWKAMKSLCESAGVDPKKVFPHNLRHLFARTYYQLEKDLLRLADLLGHSNISTTRIYTMESGDEHAKQLERMRLIYSDI